jgi:hypothetical protein
VQTLSLVIQLTVSHIQSLHVPLLFLSEIAPCLFFVTMSLFPTLVSQDFLLFLFGKSSLVDMRISLLDRFEV